MAMSSSMLGPLEVRSAGVALELGPGLQRSLLVALLLAPNRVLPTDRIVATLWDGEPPKPARANVRTYVSRLRGVLVDERNAAWVGARQSGYLLGVQDGELDLEVFDRLAREGRAALAAGQWVRAESRLAAALALWRGTAAQDVRRTTALDPRLAALDESRLAATEDWITARQHLGAGPELIGLLRRLTGEHPLRERLWSRLVAAVYAGGDAGGALTVYRQARAALVENLGIEPGPELAALHRAILARDPALTGPTGPLPSAAASSKHRSTSPKPPPAGEPQVRMTVQLDLRAIDLPLATQRLALAFSGLGIEPSVQASTRGGARPL